MAESKPFEATPSRLARARREGDLPRSQDLGAVAGFGCATLTTFAVLGIVASAARVALVEVARSGTFSAWPYVTVGACAAAIIAAGFTGSVVASYLQAGGLTLHAPTIKLEKLNPLSGFKRLFSRDSAVVGGEALVIASAVAGALVPMARDLFTAATASVSPLRLAWLTVHALERAVAATLAVATLFAALDSLLQRTKWRRRLRMTFDELKRDQKASEGDPQQKGRRKASHRALMRGSIGKVKDAAFVVTNPTHVAIALEYHPPEVAVPRVLVRAIDAGARRVKERARQLQIPIVENVALARSLLQTEVGGYIPTDAYAAVAAIVAALLKTAAC